VLSFDTVRHDILLRKVAKRVNDDKVMHLLKLILKASGKRGVPQGGVISPLLSNIYLNEVDRMLEKAKRVTRTGKYGHIEYARFADDIVVLVDSHARWDWLFKAALRRLCEELTRIDVRLNEEKTRLVDLSREETFTFLGFEFRLGRTMQGKLAPQYMPRAKARTALLARLKPWLRRDTPWPVTHIVSKVNAILRGWVNYFRIGNSARCFSYVRSWIEKRIRRLVMKRAKRTGFGWKRRSRTWVYQQLGLFDDYGIRYYCASKGRPAR
jgi:RNA-directed DNA polymerase